ncbi:MAG: hypothetical protein L0219_13800 [Phycisphaerales bacterium]|nr:hypothetical protein [Phycisphaerales bacterium]
MATDLHVEGPFDIAFQKNASTKRIEKAHAAQFWQSSVVGHLCSKQGCYVFAMRLAKGFTPWYVGKAGKGFGQETFTDHKRDHYNAALFAASRGTPVMFFVTPMGNHRKVPTAELNHMEKELTQFALKKNPDLRNVQNTKNTPNWTIKGVIRASQGKPTKAASSFKTMLKV